MLPRLKSGTGAAAEPQIICRSRCGGCNRMSELLQIIPAGGLGRSCFALPFLSFLSFLPFLSFPIFLAAAVAGSAACAPYSALERPTGIPIISAIEEEDGGHIVRLYLQVANDDIRDLRLYEGSTPESAQAQDPETGVACGSLSLSSSWAQEYVIEVKGSAELQLNQEERLCAIESSLQSGNYALLRTVIQSGSQYRFSLPSNVAEAP